MFDIMRIEGHLGLSKHSGGLLLGEKGRYRTIMKVAFNVFEYLMRRK